MLLVSPNVGGTNDLETTMRKPLVAAIANFFLPGLGYLLLGTKQALAVLWLVGVIGLTWVEFGIQEPEPTLWTIMFVSVFVMNTAFAIDAYRTARELDTATTDARAASAVA